MVRNPRWLGRWCALPILLTLACEMMGCGATPQSVEDAENTGSRTERVIERPGAEEQQAEPYLTALGRHNLRPEDCIVVQDSERGLTAATAPGLRCPVVLSHWTQDGDFGKADQVLQSIRDVPRAVLD
jgi:hypothetical protein